MLNYQGLIVYIPHRLDFESANRLNNGPFLNSLTLCANSSYVGFLAMRISSNKARGLNSHLVKKREKRTVIFRRDLSHKMPYVVSRPVSEFSLIACQNLKSNKRVYMLVLETSILFWNLSAKMKASIEVFYDRISNITIADYKMISAIMAPHQFCWFAIKI